jgi:hypothetical protein
MIEKAEVPAGIRQLILRDATVPGLLVRVLPGGSRSFYFLYRSPGRGRAAHQRWLKLGSFPALSLADARAAVRGYAGDVSRGKDPAAARKEQKRKQKATLAVLFEAGGPYEASLKARGLVNVRKAMSSLRRGLNRPIEGSQQLWAKTGKMAGRVRRPATLHNVS